ncbi:Hypothetical predicted protein [Podarcis lilfordi]|uniref:Uncharacterized protein n=1 Tax=Podarcis lilfordi TaxID=74358 RepID=A0AA35PAW3_9SAUR|nr:Hypothetical predicted protein [Podarcis lilfordi]
MPGTEVASFRVRLRNKSQGFPETDDSLEDIFSPLHGVQLDDPLGSLPNLHFYDSIIPRKNNSGTSAVPEITTKWLPLYIFFSQMEVVLAQQMASSPRWRARSLSCACRWVRSREAKIAGWSGTKQSFVDEQRRQQLDRRKGFGRRSLSRCSQTTTREAALCQNSLLRNYYCSSSSTEGLCKNFLYRMNITPSGLFPDSAGSWLPAINRGGWVFSPPSPPFDLTLPSAALLDQTAFQTEEESQSLAQSPGPES